MNRLVHRIFLPVSGDWNGNSERAKAMIDYKSIKTQIRFAIEHHGTKTQGEAYRYDQVADYIIELFEQVVAANEAVTEALQDYDKRITVKVSAQ